MTWSDKLRDLFHSKKKKLPDDLETPEENKERWRSIYIVYFIMFLVSLGFSIIVTGVWPYLDKLDPTAGKQFMGLVVAANPFGQMLFSPLVGWLSNKLGSIRIPLIISLVVFTISSAVYSSLELFENHRKHIMLWTRFMVGVSSANVAACRSYLSAATRYDERTQAVSMISLAQVLGFIVGPAIQAAVVPLGDTGVWLIPNNLRLNMYTASGWVNVLLSLSCIYLFLPSVFKEHKIAAREAMVAQGTKSENDTWKSVKPDYFGAWTLIVAFFVILFNFMLMETLGTALIMDQFAWSKAEAMWYMGILMSAGCIMALATFASIGPISKRFSEVKIMIWIGFFFMVLGRIVFIPIGTQKLQIYDSDLKLHLAKYCGAVFRNHTLENDFNMTVISEGLSRYNKSLDMRAIEESEVRNMTMNCGEELVGCPSSQKWCEYTPPLTLSQFLLGYFLTAFSYPLGVTLIQTLFSKLLGPRPQGVWMGLMTGAGCLSRVLGPFGVTFVYEKFGTVWTFVPTAISMAAMLVWLLCFQKRLTPVGPGTADTEKLNTGTVELQEVGKDNA